jgi:hypothetical protein
MQRLLALLLVLSAIGCQAPSRSDLTQLDRMKTQADPRANAAESISCTAQDLVCVQLLVARGSACLRLTEEADRAFARQRRQCALDDFAAAARQLPDPAPAEDRRQVLTGLAAARKVARDNTLDAAAAAALNAEIAASAPALRMVQGGAPYAAYFAADTEVFTAQRGGMEAAQACRSLQATLSGLPATGQPADLAPRVALLRSAIAASISARRCA